MLLPWLDLRLKKWFAIFGSRLKITKYFLNWCVVIRNLFALLLLIHKTFLKKRCGPKKDLFANPFEKWFAISQKWFAVPKTLTNHLANVIRNYLKRDSHMVMRIRLFPALATAVVMMSCYIITAFVITSTKIFRILHAIYGARV